MLCGGILFAFLSGKSAGRKDEKLGNLKDDIKKNKKSIKKTKKIHKSVKKSLASKKKSLEEIKKQRESFGAYNNPSSNAKDASDFLKKYTKNKK